MPSSARSRQTAAPQAGAVLADAAGEDDRLGAAELDEVGPQIVPHIGGEDLQREFRPGVAGRGRRFQVAHVAADAAEAQQAALVVQYRQHLVERLAGALA